MRKNNTDQRGAIGIVATALVYTTNANPVPVSICIQGMSYIHSNDIRHHLMTYKLVVGIIYKGYYDVLKILMTTLMGFLVQACVFFIDKPVKYRDNAKL